MPFTVYLNPECKGEKLTDTENYSGEKKSLMLFNVSLNTFL